MSHNNKLILIATQAVNTNENNLFIEAAEELGIHCVIFSLDDLNIYYGDKTKGFEISHSRIKKTTTRFGSIETLIKNELKNDINFREFFDEDDSNIIITPGILNKFQIVMLVRRLGISSPINLGELSELFSSSTEEIENAEEIKFSSYIQQFLGRLNKLHYLEKLGVRIINRPGAIENSMDKFISTQVVSRSNFKKVKIIDTAIISNYKSLMRFYSVHNKDIILKPIFGSRGVGIIRLNEDLFSKIIENIQSQFDMNTAFLAQEFIQKSNGVIRVLVFKNNVIAIMNRIPSRKGQWKINIHRGATATKYDSDEKVIQDLCDDSVELSKLIGCELCGVDIIHNEDGFHFLETNSIPGLITINSPEFYMGENKSIFYDIINNL